MTITIAGIEFDHHDYDEHGDTLYLHVGPPIHAPASALETPEGHIVEYDEHGSVVGLELLNVRWSLDQQGSLTVSWPPVDLQAAQLGSALVAG
jgi:uncharacterized protein YuzE